MKKMNRSWWNAIALLLAVSWAGCAKTTVKPMQEQQMSGPVFRPTRVFVYDFAVSATDVSENQGFFAGVRNAMSDETEHEREHVIGQEVQNRMSEDLVAGIQELGLPAQRVARGTLLPADTIAVTGLFINVDEGNRLRRTVVGFGAGASKVDAQVQIHALSTSGPNKLLEFTTHAHSGSMPGVAVTGAAGAAAQGGMTAGVAAVNMAKSAAQGYRSQVEQMAARSADQAVAYLSQYFANQGWIAQDKVKQAKVASN